MSNTKNKENQSDQVVSVNPEVVVENIKETSIWLRLVLVIIFLFVFHFYRHHPMVNSWSSIFVYNFYKKT